jgi:hypothetical protein
MRISLLLCSLFVASLATPHASAQTLRFTPPVETPTDGYDQVLARYATKKGFDYAGLAADADAKRKLSAYLKWLETLPESASLADWLNAYNALVVSSVLKAMPVKSVMDDAGFFKKREHRVAGRPRTLDAIENEIIRPRFRDARVHFALNCAARSCPALHGRAFRPEGLDDTLARLTRAALADERHVRMRQGALELSAIFFWFEQDFVRDAGSVRGFVRRHAPKAIALQVTDETPLVQREYDWALNAA